MDCNEARPVCCPGTDCVDKAGACNVQPWPCFATSQCLAGGGLLCAVTGKVTSGGDCKPFRLNADMGSSCVQELGSQIELCTPGGQNPCRNGKSCVAAVVELAGDAETYRRSVGVCQ
jgi:hypothetical protein